MLKARTLKGLALLSVTAFLSNSVINNTLLTTPDGEDAITLDDYDDILASISRRLQLSPANDRLRSVRAHHAQMLMERGIDPHSSRFKELMRERMRRVNVKRRERGGERKILRKLELRGESVWKGTPLTMLETGMHHQDQRNLDTTLLEPLEICGRSTNVGALNQFSLLPQFTCPASSSSSISPDDTTAIDNTGNSPFDTHTSDHEQFVKRFAMIDGGTNPNIVNNNKPNMLLLSGTQTFGRTGNNLIEFLHALQVARDKDLVLGMMHGSWAMQVLMGMFLAIDGEGWEKRWEEAFCAKIIKSEEELQNYNVLEMTTKQLFGYTSQAPYDEYVASTQYSIRALFQNYNTGKNGRHIRGNRHVQDMCSGIDALFPMDQGRVLYSVIHSRHLEGAPGLRLLNKVCRHAKCDTKASLEMRPDYIKSILAPLGMMEHPIVLITDGQDFAVIQRLMADADIGPMLKVVPEEASWIGGDLTLGIMSNVFIGNPASTFSTFIAKSRLSLGFGHNYLFRRKTAEGVWVSSCGDGCVFDKRVMDVMS